MTDSWTSVFRSPGRRPCEERALVLGAMGIDHRVSEQPDGCHLWVAPADASRALEELRRYQQENPPRAAAVMSAPAPGQGLGVVASYSLLLLLFFLAQLSYSGGIDWLGAGEAVAGRIVQGEWWRAVTALMLHADTAHFVGNLVFGAFFAFLLGQYVGSGTAAAAMLTAGAAGNLINAWLQLPDHRSIGASTAVFAALGVVAAQVSLGGRFRYRSWAHRAAPLVAGVGLLAYLGTGDEHTDVAAHLAGFLAGAVVGACLRLAGPLTRHPLFQLACAVAAPAMVCVAWLLAVLGPAA